MTTKRIGLAVCLAAFLGACGGGGGSAGGTNPLDTLPYTGPATQAAITDDNAVALALAAYLGSHSGGVLSAMASGETDLPTFATPRRPVLQAIARDATRLVTGAERSALAGRLSPRSIQSAHDVIPGTYGGTAETSMTWNDVTHEIVGTMRFVAFNDDGYVTLDGDTSFRGWLDSPESFRITFTFVLVRSTTPDGATTISGDVYVDASASIQRVTMNLRQRDDGTNKVSWLEHYASSSIFAGDHVEGGLVGRFHDPDRGFVDLSTGAPFRTYAGSVWPSQGVLLLHGRAGGRVKLEFVSSATFRVSADKDGDGVFEFDSGLTHWTGANSPPVANAGADRTGYAGTSVTLDGSGSSDPDGDPLVYRWSFSSRPPGSAAVLANATGVTPSFTPDLPGTYAVALIVNDGFVDSQASTAIVAVGYGALPSLSFDPWTAIPTGSWANAVAIGDVNGDGRNDVVLATTFYNDPSNDYTLFVFLQTPSGALAAPVRYPGVNGASVAIGDVNGDGRNDVIATANNAIGIFLQNASGGLDPMVARPSNHSSSTNTYLVRIGDFNHDGRLDVVSMDWGTQSQAVDIHYQDANGVLAAPVSYTVAHGGWDDLEAGDVTGDGLTDVVVMSGQGFGPNLGVLPQRQGGGFDAPAYYSVADPVTNGTLTKGVGVGDLNGDGRADVAVTWGGNTPSARMGVFTQGSAGTLNAVASYSAYDLPEPLEVADINGDGRQDVVVLHGAFAAMGVYPQRADGSLGPEELYPVSYASHYRPNGIAVGDINGDGRRDAAIADYGSGLVILYQR